jgi:hypothetical protein
MGSAMDGSMDMAMIAQSDRHYYSGNCSAMDPERSLSAPGFEQALRDGCSGSISGSGHYLCRRDVG